MTQDSLARKLSAGGEPSDDPIYDALVKLLGATERGRAFLEEHARRSRAADTAAALRALGRIEAMLTNQHGVVPTDAPHEDEAHEDEAPAEEPEASSFKSADLLAQVMALSPEERIALFS